MHAVDFLDAEALHHAVLDHGKAAAAAFFRRLEHHDRRPGEVARLGEVLGRAQQHRRMPVMAAGVHLARHGGLIRQAGFLDDGQRVHVGAKSHHLRPRLVAPDDPDHAGPANARHHLVTAKGFQFVGHQRRRPVNVVLQLRVGMDVVPPAGDFPVQVGDAVDNRHGRFLVWRGSLRRYPGHSASLAELYGRAY